MTTAKAETVINWFDGDENAELSSTDRSIIMRMRRAGVESETIDGVEVFKASVDDVMKAMTGKMPSRSNRVAKEYSHEEKVERLFRLRAGKIRKSNGGTLTKKQEDDIRKDAEETVTAKEKAEA